MTKLLQATCASADGRGAQRSRLAEFLRHMGDVSLRYSALSSTHAVPCFCQRSRRNGADRSVMQQRLRDSLTSSSRRASDSRSGRKTICRVVLACHQLHTQPCRPGLLPAAYTAPAYHVCQRRASSAHTHLNRFKCPEHKQSQCLKRLSRSNLRLCNKGFLVDQSRIPLVWFSCKTIRNINETKRFEPVRTIPSNPISYDCC